MELTITEEAVEAVVATVSGTIGGALPLIAFVLLVPLVFYIGRRLSTLFPKARTR